MPHATESKGPFTPGRHRARVVRDRLMRALGVPVLGLSIPQVTGALKPLTWQQPGYWIGVVLFLLFAFVVWQGNRWILLQLRDRFDWLQRPRQRIAALLVATFLYTVPATLVAVILWYKLGPIGQVNWAAVASSTFLVEIAVIGVTNIYETWFLVTDRFEDRLRLERNERRRVEMELNGLKSQLAPHFLFNCLNTLNVLIAEDPAAARTFTQSMASVCRYLLEQQRRELVPLHEERDFFDAYATLARLRFPSGLQIDVIGFESTAGLLIPPASLQLLLENAIKHNGISEKAPLRVTVKLEGDTLTFSNPLRFVPDPPRSTQVGLKNLRERFLLTVGRELVIDKSGGCFRVILPLARNFVA
ncbi:MAG: histidine kinase [Opitutaceae bacterium]|nr:histidine kinase [Opitutaceae bacterium]